MDGVVPDDRASRAARGGSAARPGPRPEPRPSPQLWPHDFGRDGSSGLVTLDRATRAREVSRPTAEDEAEALEVVERLLARIDGRRPRTHG